MDKSTVLIAMLSASASIANGQTAPVTINEDNSATISVRFPEAGEVLVKGSFLPKAKTYQTPAGTFGKEGKREMERDSAGWWRFSTGILTSEMYTYNFEVDERDTVDTANANRVRDINTWYDYFFITGGIADNYITQNVPHGKVSLVWYPSSLPNLPRRRMAVYTPPGYSTAKKFPTLYLLHGTGGDEKSWLELGRAQQIVDNLIAQGKCKPMVVVMANGIANRAATPGEDPYNDKPASGTAIESMFGLIESSFINDVVKYVESHYSVMPQKEQRAIAGLSLGGLHTIYITANNPDYFDYIGLFSAQTTNQMSSKKNIGRLERLASSFDKITDYLPFLGKGKKLDRYADYINEGKLTIYQNTDGKLKKLFGRHPKLYYIAYGNDDFVRKINEDFRKKLDDHGYKYVLNITDGGHTWENWRKYLVDFLPRLFQDKQQ